MADDGTDGGLTQENYIYVNIFTEWYVLKAL